jgi:hypothetical protein
VNDRGEILTFLKGAKDVAVEQASMLKAFFHRTSIKYLETLFQGGGQAPPNAMGLQTEAELRPEQGRIIA